MTDMLQVPMRTYQVECWLPIGLRFLLIWGIFMLPVCRPLAVHVSGCAVLYKLLQ